MRFSVLGPVEVSDGGRALGLPGFKPRVLLAALLCRPGGPVCREDLADALWPGTWPAAALDNIRSYVHHLRRALGQGRVVRSGEGYLIDVWPGELDADVFSGLALRGSAALAAGRPGQASDLLHEALGLWRGAAFTGMAGAALIAAEASRLEERRLAALEDRIEADLALGRHAILSAELSSLVAAYPLRERLQAQLMTALYRSDRQAGALQAYQRARTVLVSELGIEPGPALQRLQQAILRGDPVLEWPVPPAGAALGEGAAAPVPAQLPRDPGHFTGREEYLRRLDDLARGKTATGIIVITGPPGVGKTALAVHWAHRIRYRFADGQLYVDLRGYSPERPTRPVAALGQLLRGLGADPAAIPAGLDAAAGLYRTMLAGRRMVVLLDNAASAEQVRPLIPGDPGCLVVVTSRDRLCGLVAGEGAEHLTLDVLSAREAYDLLAGRAGRMTAEPQAAAELVTLCGRLPLALNVAAARLATHPGLPVSAVVSQLSDARHRLDALATEDAATSVRGVFSWSYQRLTGAAARMFRLLGVHAGPDISAAAAASLAGLPPPQARATLDELTRLHLIIEHQHGRFTLHDLIRAYAAESAVVGEDTAAREAAVRRVLDHYACTARSACLLMDPVHDAAVVPPPRTGVTPEQITGDAHALAWFTAERSPLLRALALAADAGLDTHVWAIAWSTAKVLGCQGHWDDWIAALHMALTSAGNLHDRAGQARAHRRLGEALVHLGSLQDAAPHLRRALTLHRQLKDHAGLADVHLGLAYLLEQQDRYRDSLTHARQALRTYRDLGDRAGQARALNSIGWCQALTGEHRQALGHCQQALTLHHDLGDRFGQAATLDSLGYAHHQLGQHAQAIACYQRALGLYSQLGERYLAADALAHLGDTYRAIGDHPAARQAWEPALATLDDLAHPSAGRLRAKLDQLPSHTTQTADT